MLRQQATSLLHEAAALVIRWNYRGLKNCIDLTPGHGSDLQDRGECQAYWFASCSGSICDSKPFTRSLRAQVGRSSPRHTRLGPQHVFHPCRSDVIRD